MILVRTEITTELAEQNSGLGFVNVRVADGGREARGEAEAGGLQ